MDVLLATAAMADVLFSQSREACSRTFSAGSFGDGWRWRRYFLVWLSDDGLTFQGSTWVVLK